MTSDRKVMLRGRPKAGRTPAKRAFGLALEALRMMRGLKQSDIARATGLTKAMISAFETGKVSPSLESLFTYLGGVGCNLGDLQRALDQEAEWQEGTQAPLAPSADDVYRRIGKAVVQAIEEVCRGLGMVETKSSSEQPPSAGTSEGENRREE